MSGFISNLLARNRGAADVVQPRVPSLFEPPATGSPAAAWDGVTESERETSSPPEPADTRALKPAPESAPHIHEAARPDSQPVRGETDRGDVVETVTSPRLAPKRPAPAAPEPAMTFPPPRETVTPRVPESTPVARRSNANTNTAEPRPVVTPAHRPESELSVRREPLPSEPQRKSQSSHADGIPGQRSPMFAPPPPTLLSPALNRPRFEPGPKEPAAVSSEPTVQVTIGRIEVRAVAGEQPQRKDRSAPSVMSLDEYLKQRAGGTRR